MSAMSPPRTYPLSPGWKYFVGVFGLAAVAAGLACLVFGAGAGKPVSAHVVMYALGVLSAGGGAWCIAYATRFRVVLSEHLVEVHGVWKVEAMRRDEIASGRVIPGSDSPSLQLMSRRPGRKPLQVPMVFRMDDAFRAWLETIPDAGAAQLQRAADAVASNRDFGDTVPARHAHVARYARIVQWLGYASLALMLWALVHPRPYALVIGLVILLPLVALALMPLSKGAVGLDGYVDEHRPLVGPMLLLPGYLLVVRAWLDVDTLDWLPGLGIAAAMAVPLAFAIERMDRSLRTKGPLMFGVLFVFPYLYGALVLTNFLLDPSRPQRFEATVLGKQENKGKSTTFELTLGPWGPRPGMTEVEVSRTLYEKAAVGEPVCVHLFEGRWKLAWYVTRACPGTAPP